MRVQSLELLSAVRVLEITKDTQQVVREYLKRNRDLFNELIHETNNMSLKEFVLHSITTEKFYKDSRMDTMGCVYQGMNYVAARYHQRISIFRTGMHSLSIKGELITFYNNHIMFNNSDLDVVLMPLLQERVVITSVSEFENICWPYLSRLLDILVERKLLE
jgi:hypothetical protein